MEEITNKNELEKNIENLSKNVLFSLKELFHSNFWAWLMRKYPEIFLNVFIGEDPTEPKILREYQNFDLFIENNGNTFVIENKFISVPCIQQLEKYDYKLRNSTTKKFLITYINPFFKEAINRKKFDLSDKNQNDWNIITYEDLTVKLKEEYDKNATKISDDFDKKFIEKYLYLLNLLNNLQNIIKIEDDMTIKEFYSQLNTQNIKSKLQQINFEKTLERIFVNQLTKYILDKYENKHDIDNININCGRDHIIYSDILFYCNKNAYAPDFNDRSTLNEIGVSLWGYNYRHYANINKIRIKKPDNDNAKAWKEAGHKCLENEFCKLFNKEDEYIKGGYNYKDDMWLYKKIDISNQKIGEIKKMVQNDLKIAYEYTQNNTNID